MNKNNAFSLAEALITLLIVCIIAIATAPIITKKAKKSPANVIWVADTQVKSAVTPAGQKDIRLGDESGHKQQGIVVAGAMYFKDRKGKIIGWISEDGSTSFAQGNEYDFNAMSQKQEKLLQMVQSLMTLLQNERKKSNSSKTSLAPNTKSPVNPDKMDEAQLQEQLNSLLEMLNTQNR